MGAGSSDGCRTARARKSVQRSSTSACVLDQCAFQISMHVGSISAFTKELATCVAQLLLMFNRRNVLAHPLCVEGSCTGSVAPALITRGNRMFRYLFRRMMHSASAHRRPIPTGALPASNSSYSPTTDNCTGLGWRELLRDRSLVARQGQLVFLQPQQGLHSLYSGMRQGGYIFSRTDAVVVGGTDDEINNAMPTLVSARSSLPLIKLRLPAE